MSRRVEAQMSAQLKSSREIEVFRIDGEEEVKSEPEKWNWEFENLGQLGEGDGEDE